MGLAFKDGECIACFHHLAMSHDDNVIGEACHHAKVMADQQQCHVVLHHQFLQQVENARLHKHIERGSRLVGNQQLGFHGTGHGDDDALALATGQFVGIA